MNQVSLVPPDGMEAGVEPGTRSEQAVRQPTPDSNGFIFWLDEPQAWCTTSRWLRALGWRIIYSPYAELIHHESISRGIENTPEKQRRFFKESEFLLNRWGALIENDPAYNPNLSLGEKRFELAFPPRVTPPWKKSLAQPVT
jgi:hypothetical protein